MEGLKYALIYENEVKNRFECENYELANILARAAFGDEAFAVDCLQYPCRIGDKYYEGAFYHVNDDGSETMINCVPTAYHQIAILNAQIAYLSMMSGIEMEVDDE